MRSPHAGLASTRGQKRVGEMAYSRQSAAREMVRQIRTMEGNVTNSRGELLPVVTSFAMLHDYFDANLGWSDDIDALPISEWHSLVDLVDSILSYGGTNV